MVDVTFADAPEMEDVQTQVDRVEGITYEGVTLAHRTGLERVLDYDPQAETVTIDFQQLIRVLIEHAQYEAAAHSPLRLAILRGIEQGADGDETAVVTMEQIQDSLDRDVATSTLYANLRTLIDDGLVERIGERSGVYRYQGP